MSIIGDVATTNENPIKTGVESSISNYAGPYVTNMLGQGAAAANEPYQAYMGPLTAGTSELQDQAFQGLGSLDFTSGMGQFNPQTFTADTAAQYMNPYIMSALQPQIDEARRQSEIDRIANAGRLTKAGAFGGSRQAVLEGENQRALQANLAGITGRGYADAFSQAMGQFNVEQDRGIAGQKAINEYGLEGLAGLAGAGGIQRDIESEGIVADRLQFEEERDDPLIKVQYMASLLQNLPLESQAVSYEEPNYLARLTSDAADVEGLLSTLFGKTEAQKKKDAEDLQIKPLAAQSGNA